MTDITITLAPGSTNGNFDVALEATGELVVTNSSTPLHGAALMLLITGKAQRSDKLIVKHTGSLLPVMSGEIGALVTALVGPFRS